MSPDWNPLAPAWRQRLPLAEPPLDTLSDPLLDAARVRVDVLRLDRMHPLWGGNKIYKLAGNLLAAGAGGFDSVTSFGGAHSNHLHALAACAAALGWRSAGIVRGDAHVPPSATLEDLARFGMRLRFVDRAAYRKRGDAAWRAQIAAPFAPAWVIPEGGDNPEGFAGCRGLGRWIAVHPRGGWDLLALACGTGTTLAGVAAGAGLPALGFAAARDLDGIRARIASSLAAAGDPPTADIALDARFAGRGFGRSDTALRQFVADFERRHAIPLDPVYTAKLFRGVFARAVAGEFAAGTRLLVIHTGGLQGRRGMASGTSAVS